MALLDYPNNCTASNKFLGICRIFLLRVKLKCLFEGLLYSKHFLVVYNSYIHGSSNTCMECVLNCNVTAWNLFSLSMNESVMY